MGYGLTTVIDDGSRYDGGLLGRALIQDGVVFTMGDLPTSFELTDISDVSVRYGTGLNEPNIPETIPEPGTIALTAAGFLAVGLLNRRRR